MKSMEQMQSEMLAQARWDGGYPRAVCLFPGIVALAHDEKQWNQLNRQNEIGLMIYIGCLLLGALGIAIWMIFW